mgnify:FL=1|tara:strand:- start:558 stop:1157 length:600 start_codon:yes stop_codon:yes gene_type:complete
MNQDIFQEGIKYLLSVETKFKKLVPKEEIKFFLRPSGFEGICSLVIEQQISVAAAESIKNKVFHLMDNVCSSKFIDLEESLLRSAGLSRPKINYLKGIAEHEISGKLEFNKINAMDDDEAREYLCRLKGIGNWTADCYLMACLGRQDIWPIGDIGLQEGVRKLKNLTVRPDINEMIAIADDWRPYRSVAANLLWRDYDE